MVGFICAMGAFIISYARVPAITTAAGSQSTVIRTFEERMHLKNVQRQVP